MENRKEKLYNVIAEVLEIEVADINEDFCENDSEKWDSLAQLMIVEGLENEFHVTIPIEKAMELTSIKSILTFLEEAGV